MTGCGKPPGSCGFDPSLTCGQLRDVSIVLENECAPSSGSFVDGIGSWFQYRSIIAHVDPNDPTDLIVDGDPMADPANPVPMYVQPLQAGINFLYESWIDPCTSSWWRLRYDSCGRAIGYEQKQYDTPADLEQALRDLRGFDSDTDNNAVSLECKSFVLGGVPTNVNITVMGVMAPFIVTGSNFGYQVFVLDTANNLYFRDPYNVQCTKPFFPNTCCDGATFIQYYFSGAPKAPGDTIDLNSAEGALVNAIQFIFSSATCRWYVNPVQPTTMTAQLAQSQDLSEAPLMLCILQCCWDGCQNKTSINSNCPDALAKPSLCCNSCCP